MTGATGAVGAALAPEVLAALTAGTASAGVLVLAAGLVGRAPGPSGRPSRRHRLPHLSRRALLSAGAGVLALVLTRWLVAGIGIGLLVACWDRLFGAGAEAGRGIARLEALATWTESLRDTIAGAIGLEQAIPATASTSAPVLRPSLNLLVDRLRIREPLPEALVRFADDVDDPSADVVCAALVLNARLRGPGLRDVLTALAASTREELDVRRRIEASRRSIRRSVQIVLLIVLGVMGLLAVFNRPYVAPYSSLPGQLALAVVGAVLVVALLWLRRLARVETHERFLAAGAGAGR